MITSEEVYQARYDARLTQRESAMLIGVSKRTWESWECGARNCPVSKMILFRLLTATTVAPQTPVPKHPDRQEPPP